MHTRSLPKLLCCLAVLAVTRMPGATAQYTAHQERYLMDPGWRFTPGDPPGAESARYPGDTAWTPVNLPDDWSIRGTWSRDNPSGSAGGYAQIGIGWYRKTFVPPEAMTGKQVYLDFDGVFDHADVWLNGQKIGHHDYGYIGFHCDLTPWIRPGRKNILAVRVDNFRQASRWYTGSGIFRHVWLYATGRTHLTHWGTCVTTRPLSGSRALVRVQSTLVNDRDTTSSCRLQTRLFDPAGRLAATETSTVTIPARGKVTTAQDITLSHPHLWGPKHPGLYKAVSQVLATDGVEDTYQTSFGIRTIRWDVNDGFSLNGKRIVIKGVCLHHDLGALGSAAYDGAIRRRLLILKSMDVNAVRLSHNPYSPEMLQLCDSLGMLVFDECFDKWYGFYPDGRGWKKTLSDFILRDRNHPSVIIWSVGNEMTPHMYTHWGTRIFQSMKALVHTYDERPVTAALHPVRTADGRRDAPLAEIASFMDVISMNYQTRFYPRDHKEHPHQVLLGSETHVNQRNLSSPHAPGDGSSNQWFGTRDYRTNRYFSYVGGQFIWAGFDYLGEAGPWPSKGSRKNLIETTGFRKPFSYYIQSLYTDTPLVHIAVADPHYYADRAKYGGFDWLALRSDWDWSPRFDSLRVYTFSNQPQVELILNGKSLGTRSLRDYPQRIISWEVPNSPGVLEAVAKRDGKTVTTHILQTTGAAVRLVLSPDQTTLSGSGEDLSFITVKAVDARGRTVPENGRVIHFRVSGPATLAGVDNGDLDSPESFNADHRSLRNGKCLVIIRSAARPGTVTVTATADGLTEAKTLLEVNAVSGPHTL